MMDRMIGKDYERGLKKLKSLLESMPNADIAGFVAEPVVTARRTYFGRRRVCASGNSGDLQGIRRWIFPDRQVHGEE